MSLLCVWSGPDPPVSRRSMNGPAPSGIVVFGPMNALTLGVTSDALMSSCNMLSSNAAGNPNDWTLKLTENMFLPLISTPTEIGDWTAIEER